jgi:hypothetical protein
MEAHEAIRQLLSDVKNWQRQTKWSDSVADACLESDTIEQHTAREARGWSARLKAVESGRTVANLLGAGGKPVWRFVSLLEPPGDPQKAAALWPEVFAELNVLLAGSAIEEPPAYTPRTPPEPTKPLPTPRKGSKTAKAIALLNKGCEFSEVVTRLTMDIDYVRRLPGRYAHLITTERKAKNGQ